MVKEDGGGRPDTVVASPLVLWFTDPELLQVLDITMVIEELHKLSPHEMKKILRDPHCLSFRLSSGKGTVVNVDIERLASFLPLHLLACVASSISQPRFRHLLQGVRLLHSLSNLAPRYPKLEQILLQEVKLREQIVDLVIFTLIVLAEVGDGRWGSFLAVLHSALVACCLYLLTAFVTPEWRDVAPVLLAHPKVDVFMDAAFDAVKRDIVLLQSRFKALSAKLAKEKAPTMCGTELVSSTTLEHCEASLQVLQSLCDSQAFRDRLLNHKELCQRGGILSLVQVVLQLQLPSHLQHIPSLSASISRLKAKVLAMLLKFCETETVSFLDEVAKDDQSMQMAKLVAAEIVSLVKGAFFETFTVQMVHEDIEKCPTGMLYLNAMRLADVLSDDSNFRNLFMDRIAPDLATILAMDPSEFCSKWCGGCSAQDMADCEIDATILFDPFHGSGAAMLSLKPSGSSSDEGQSGCSLSIKPVEPTFYAQELSALLVKLFANLHCFNPEVCPADEKDRFLCLFMRCLSVGPLSPLSSSFFMTPDQTAVRVCENLHILVDHVASLPLELANDEDVQLASVFAAELHETFCLSPAEAEAEAPVVTYVRDAHEQRLRAIVARRLPSERWQRLQRAMERINREAQARAAEQEIAEQEVGEPEEASSAIDSKAEVDPQLTAEVHVKPPDPDEEVGVKSGDLPEEECVSAMQGDEKEPIVKPEENAVIKTETEEPEAVIPKEEPDEKAELNAAFEHDLIKDGGRLRQEEVGTTDRADAVLSATAVEAATPSQIESNQPVVVNPFMDRPANEPLPPQRLLSCEKKEADEERVNHVRKFEEDARLEQTEQPRKRQRRIMSENQITIMESALKDEPEMQRYPDRVQHWTLVLNRVGPEISNNQLKNWINNRKAKLAKMAKEGRYDPSSAEKSSRARSGQLSNAGSEDVAAAVDESGKAAVLKPEGMSEGPIVSQPSVTEIGQRVVLRDDAGNSIAMGITKAVTPGEEGAVAMCLVEIQELRVDRSTKLPIGSDFMGTTFDEAEKKLGKLIVAWPSNNVRLRDKWW